MLIQWNPSFEIEHDRIDEQHRVFVELICDLSQAAGRNASRDRLQRILRQIHAYAMFHFITEENIMLDVDYPQYESHRGDHQRLLGELVSIMGKHRNGQVPVQDIAEYAFRWFEEHAKTCDQRLANHLRGA